MAIRSRTAGVAAAFILALGAPMAPAVAASDGPVYDGSTTFTAYNTQITSTKKSVEFTLSAKDSSAVKFAVSKPDDGSVSVGDTDSSTTPGESTAKLTFTPSRTTTFTDTVVVTMTDDDGKTATQTIKLAMAQNAVPTGTAITGRTTPVNKPVEIALNGKDTESGTTGLTYAPVAGKTTNGTVVIDQTKATFTPDAGYVGDASFQYTVTDPQGGVSDPITVSITVTKTATVAVPTLSDPQATVVGDTATITTTVTPNPSNSPDALTGKVTFYTVDANGNHLSTLGEGTRGTGTGANTWTLKTTALSGGPNRVVAEYTGDSAYGNAKSDAAPIELTPATARVDLKGPNAIRAGQKFSASATVTPATGAPAPTGKVQFNWTPSGGTAQPLGDPVAATNGTYNLTDAVVKTAGEGTLTASFLGDANLNPADSTASFTVTKGTSTVAVTVPGAAQASGSSVPLVATVSPGVSVTDGTDTVQFFDNGDPITGADAVKVTVDGKGVATANYDYVVATKGKHAITARFNGGDNLYASSDSASAPFQVTQATSTTKLEVSNTSSLAVGDRTNLTATVKAQGQIPTGKVQFYVGGNAIGEPETLDAGDAASGTATAVKKNYAFATAGTESFTAKYLGDDNAAASTSDAVTATVKVAATTTVGAPGVTVVGSDGKPTTVITAGAEATITSKVTPAEGTLASDKVSFYDGAPTGDTPGSLLGTGTMDPTTGIATLKHTFDTATTTASHTIYAVFSGNANLPKADAVAGTPFAVNPAVATIALTGSSEGVGTATKLTATVDLKGADPKNAKVQFADAATGNTLGDPVEVVDGKAVYSTPNVTSAGMYKYTATLTGDNITSPAPATTSVKVASAKSGQKLTSKVESDGTVTLTDTVSGPEGVPTDGTVTFFSDGEQVGTGSVLNGVATLASVKLGVGSHAVIASYRSSGDLSDSVASATVVVKGVSKVMLNAPESLTAGKEARFGVMVSGDAEAKPFGGDITLVEGKTVVAKGVVDTNGVGSITTSTLKEGKHDLLVSFAGNDTLMASDSDTVSVDVAPAAEPTDQTLKVEAASIAGVPTVGHQLSLAKKATVDHDASLSYKWLRDGVAISGATGTKYMLTAADAGHRISVQAIATLEGYKLASKTSAATAAVAKGAISVKASPVLKGSGKVGYKLIASPGSYSPAGHVSYTWMRDGKVFKTGVNEYRLVKADRGHRFAVKVTVSATGYNTLSKTTNTVAGK